MNNSYSQYYNSFNGSDIDPDNSLYKMANEMSNSHIRQNLSNNDNNEDVNVDINIEEIEKEKCGKAYYNAWGNMTDDKKQLSVPSIKKNNLEHFMHNDYQNYNYSNYPKYSHCSNNYDHHNYNHNHNNYNNHNNHNNNIDSHDSHLNHILNCIQCRNYCIKYLEKKYKKNYLKKPTIDLNNDNTVNFSYNKNNLMRDLLVVLIICLIIILLVDLFSRNDRRY